MELPEKEVETILGNLVYNFPIFTGSFVSPNFWGIIYIGGIAFACSFGLRKLWLRRPRVIFRLLYPKLSICEDFLNRKAANEPLPEDWRRILSETYRELTAIELSIPTYLNLSYSEMAEYLAYVAAFSRKNDLQGAREFSKKFRGNHHMNPSRVRQ